MTSQTKPGSHLAMGLALSAALAGCSGDDTGGSGSLSVLLESEDVILEGLEPGTGAENTKDGWTVEFDKYIVAIGEIDVHLATDSEIEAEAHEVHVVDLKQVPANGLALWSLEGLATGRWNFSYRTTRAEGGERHESVSRADYDAMVDGEWTYLVEGIVTKPGGVSCPPSTLASPGADATSAGTNIGGDDCYENTEIRFALGVPAETTFGPCEIDDVEGFAIANGETQTVAATIHGDHLFFNGFPEADEGATLRLVQWFADSDLDLDGEVTQAELEAILPAALAELDPERYQLGGSPIKPVDSMWTYLRAQLKTQGHFQGEGECPVDGVAHEHEDE